MADAIGLEGMIPSGMADTFGSTLYAILKVVGVLAVIAVLFYFLYQRKQYKYDIKLKVLQNGQFAYYESKAKLLKVDGVPFWFIKGLKETANVPPPESMYLSTRGRWVAEGYFERNAGVIWSKDILSQQEFSKLAKEIAEKRTTKTPSGTETVTTHYQPMTSTERSLQANQVTKSLLRKGKDLWAMIWQLLPIIILVIIFALILIFWNDIAKPVIDLSASNAQISKDNSIMQQQNLRLYMMLTGGTGNGTYIVQELSSDRQYFLPERPEVTG